MFVPFLFLAFLIVLDLYVYRGIDLFMENFNPQRKTAVKWIYWSISIGVLLISIGAIFWSIVKGREPIQPKYWVATLWIAFLTPKLFFSVFLLIDDAVHFFRTDSRVSTGTEISRFRFLNQLGFGIFSLTLFANFFGVFFTKYRYKVRREEISFPNLPASFEGYKIVQFSDLHIGSLNGDFSQLEKAFKMISALKADLLLFTGDMVNNIAAELDGSDDVMQLLTAKDGKFSILGNHDYGDYYFDKNKEAEKHAANLQRLKDRQVELGFDLILNDSRKIERDGQSIDLIGVENWGKGWGTYGDLEKAKAKATGQFKILMSHDPSHWKHQVKGKTDIDLTLSGHTHGMQYGIEWLGLKFSPVQFVYDTWAGLYREGKQYIYVNRGLGFIGFLGRVGIRPEITEITLRKG